MDIYVHTSMNAVRLYAHTLVCIYRYIYMSGVCVCRLNSDVRSRELLLHSREEIVLNADFNGILYQLNPTAIYLLSH